MFRHFITSINYALLIKMQANQESFAPAVSRKANIKKSNQGKIKTKSKVYTHRKNDKK